MGQLRIGELARTTGTRTATIRYYERIGVLAVPARAASSHHRAYGSRDVE